MIKKYLPLLGLPPVFSCLEELLLIEGLDSEIKQGIVNALTSERPLFKQIQAHSPTQLQTLTSNPGNWTMRQPAVPFSYIYAADWNAEFENVINHCNPDRKSVV